MSLSAQPYRAPAPPASRATAARRVTRAQAALILFASLTAVGAFARFAPRPEAAPSPVAVTDEAPFTSGPLPLPPIVRAAQRPPTPRPAPRVRSPFAQSGLAAAQACMQPGRSEAQLRACIVDALRAQAATEPERRLLCVTYLDQEDWLRSESCMRDYVLLYPETRWAREFRARLRGR